MTEDEDYPSHQELDEYYADMLLAERRRLGMPCSAEEQQKLMPGPTHVPRERRPRWCIFTDLAGEFILGAVSVFSALLDAGRSAYCWLVHRKNWQRTDCGLHAADYCNACRRTRREINRLTGGHH